MILAIETATPVCSVAIQTDTGRVFEKRIEGKGVHSERMFLFIRDLLERTNTQIADLDAILFSNGPGSYTGLRIGASAIKGLLFGREVALFTCPTLLSLSAAITEPGKSCSIHAVIDARRRHLYHQRIDVDENGKRKAGKASVVELIRLNEELAPYDIVVGTGWERLTPKEKVREKITWLGSEAVSAKNLITAWNNKNMNNYFKKEDIEGFEPEYLNMARINNSPIRG